jgi:hypothetical protein
VLWLRCSSGAAPRGALDQVLQTGAAVPEGALALVGPAARRFISLPLGPAWARAWAAEQQLVSGVMSSMEQRRFFEARGEESGEWLVLDGKRHPPRVICRCVGWNAPKNAALIAAALEAHNSELCSKFSLDGSGLLNEQPAVKASGEAESPPAPKSATGKSRARHRG